MTFADSDFLLALVKPSDWLKDPANRLLDKYEGRLWTSPSVAIELLLLFDRYNLDIVRALAEVLQIAPLRYVSKQPFLLAAHYIKTKRANVFDALHAAFCGTEPIISSDKVFDRLGVTRIPLGEESPKY